MLRRIPLIWLRLSLRLSDPGSRLARRGWPAASGAVLDRHIPCYSCCYRFGAAVGRIGVLAGGWFQSAVVQDCRTLLGRCSLISG